MSVISTTRFTTKGRMLVANGCIVPVILCAIYPMAISPIWAVQIIKAVGNYGESFDRNVGEGSPLKIARGLNGLWTKGGLQYAPPIR